MKPVRRDKCADGAFDALIRESLRDPAARCRLPKDFSARVIAGLAHGGAVTYHRRLPRWAKVAAVAVLASFAGFAAWVGTARLESAGENSSGGEPATVANGDGAGSGGDAFDVENGGENMIMARKVASLVGASMLSVATPGVELTSEPTFIFLRPETSSFWNTATNNTMTLPIDYPTGATKASLTVNGEKYVKSYSDITGDSFDLELPPPTSPETENVYDLTLTFDDGTVRTAKLGLIQGLSPDAEGTTRCLAPAEGSVWNSMRSRAVLPIPYGTTSFTVTVNGRETVNDTGLNGAQGWYALGGIKRKDAVSLSLMANGVNYMATLLGRGDGYFVVNFK